MQQTMQWKMIRGNFTFHILIYKMNFQIPSIFPCRQSKSTKKSVVFSDGILPGHGTSASENDEASGDKAHRRKRKKKAARSKSRNRSMEKLVAITQANLALLEKEQSLLQQKVNKC